MPSAVLPAVYADRFGFIIQTTAARLPCLSTQKHSSRNGEVFSSTNDGCRNYFSEAAAAFCLLSARRSSAIQAERPRKARRKYSLARRTRPIRETSILAIFGECSGNTRSTPSPKEIFLTVKKNSVRRFTGNADTFINLNTFTIAFFNFGVNFQSIARLKCRKALPSLSFAICSFSYFSKCSLELPLLKIFCYFLCLNSFLSQDIFSTDPAGVLR